MRLASGRHLVAIIAAVAVVAGSVTTAQAQGTCNQWDEACKAAIKKWAVLGGIGVAGIVTVKAVLAKQKRARLNAPPSSLSQYYDSTTTRLERHVVMTPRSNCPGRLTAQGATLEAGSLPEGLTLLPDLTIAGVPAVPGDYRPSVRFTGLECKARNGQTRYYGDRTIRFVIRIEM